MNAEHAVGQIIADKYRLLRLIGAGGMGAVYEAEHVFTKRRVALKRMHQGTTQSKLAAERFVRESQAPSALGHPGIVQVLDGGFDSADRHRAAGSARGCARVVESHLPATAAPARAALPLTAAAQSAPGLTVEQITRVVAAQQPHMQSCLQDAMLAQVPTGPTTLHLDIELHIAANGRADTVRAKGAVPAALQQCVLGHLRDAVFPVAANASEFRYPLILESTTIGL